MLNQAEKEASMELTPFQRKLPSILTTSRIVLSPVFFLVFVYSFQFFGQAFRLPAAIILWVLFIAIELSDLLDGMAARKLGLSSDFGKIFDPFADSFARLTYFIAFALAPDSLADARMPGIAFVLILYRDLLVSFGRLLMAREGVSLGARISGKIKAWVYAFAGGAGLLVFSLPAFAGLPPSLYAAAVIAAQVLYWLAAATALWTATDYLLSIKTYLDGKKKA